MSPELILHPQGILANCGNHFILFNREDGRILERIPFDSAWQIVRENFSPDIYLYRGTPGPFGRSLYEYCRFNPATFELTPIKSPDVGEGYRLERSVPFDLGNGMVVYPFEKVVGSEPDGVYRISHLYVGCPKNSVIPTWTIERIGRYRYARPVNLCNGTFGILDREFGLEVFDGKTGNKITDHSLSDGDPHARYPLHRINPKAAEGTLLHIVGTIDNALIVMITTLGFMNAWDTTSHRMLWEHDMLEVMGMPTDSSNGAYGRFGGSWPWIGNGMIVLGLDEFIAFVDPRTGAIRHRVHFPWGAYAKGAPQEIQERFARFLPNDHFIFGLRDGEHLANLRTGKVVASIANTRNGVVFDGRRCIVRSGWDELLAVELPKEVTGQPLSPPTKFNTDIAEFHTAAVHRSSKPLRVLDITDPYPFCKIRVLFECDGDLIILNHDFTTTLIHKSADGGPCIDATTVHESNEKSPIFFSIRTSEGFAVRAWHPADGSTTPVTMLPCAGLFLRDYERVRTKESYLVLLHKTSGAMRRVFQYQGDKYYWRVPDEHGNFRRLVLIDSEGEFKDDLPKLTGPNTEWVSEIVPAENYSPPHFLRRVKGRGLELVYQHEEYGWKTVRVKNSRNIVPEDLGPSDYSVFSIPRGNPPAQQFMVMHAGELYELPYVGWRAGTPFHRILEKFVYQSSEHSIHLVRADIPKGMLKEISET